MKIRRNVLPVTQAPELAEIKVWGPWVFATVLWKIGAQFELATGYQLDVISDLPTTYAKWMNAGEPFDVFIGTSSLVDELIESGEIVAETRTAFGSAPIGIEVRAGAAKPDIGSVEAFKRALLNADSIAYLKIGGGLHVQNMLERIGIYDAIKSKVTRPDVDIVSELVAKGDVELGMVNTSQILTTSGVQLVGPLPIELQSSVVFAAGVSSNSKVRLAAQNLIRFLTGPNAVAVMTSQGMEHE
ncbi:MAG: substrate-binding domain-containing protein [Xanthobacteraceae bacterium]|nr:substrate-binding domain-containing protein [Xanthobacteraceae bacterium]